MLCITILQMNFDLFLSQDKTMCLYHQTICVRRGPHLKYVDSNDKAAMTSNRERNKLCLNHVMKIQL